MGWAGCTGFVGLGQFFGVGELGFDRTMMNGCDLLDQNLSPKRYNQQKKYKFSDIIVSPQNRWDQFCKLDNLHDENGFFSLTFYNQPDFILVYGSIRIPLNFINSFTSYQFSILRKICNSPSFIFEQGPKFISYCLPPNFQFSCLLKGVQLNIETNVILILDGITTHKNLRELAGIVIEPL